MGMDWNLQPPNCQVWCGSNEDLASFRPQCPACESFLCLVVQLYGPLYQVPGHRTLYVFACTTPTCWNQPHSWVVYRGQCPEKVSVSQPIVGKTSKTDDWGTDADDWGTDADDWGTERDDVTSQTNDWGATADDWGTGTDNFNTQTDDCDTTGDEPIAMETKEEELQDRHTNAGEVDIASQLPIQDISLNEATGNDVTEDDEVTDDVTDDSGTSSDEVIAETEIQPIADPRQQLCQLDTTAEQMWKKDTAEGSRQLVGYFLNVFEEPGREAEKDAHVTKLMKEYARKERTDLQLLAEESISGASGGGSGEKYEKTRLKHGDDYFHRFMKRMSLCPEQCVRYEWNGTPLYNSKVAPLTGADKQCSNCGGEVVYEFQLMPALVNVLRFPSKPHSIIEFGTVLVFSCRKSCWDSSQSLRKEKVVVLPDPDQHLFHRKP